MSVRDATVEDVDAIREIARETWHAAYDDVVGPDAVDEQVDDWYAAAVVEAGVTREDWPYLVAEREPADAAGEVVGYASGGPTDDGPADAVVASIYVRPGAWGEGNGSALLSVLHDRQRELGCDDAWLAVLADNDVGRSFYEGHGYAVGERRTAEVGGAEAEELVMVRSL
jgi:L-amino acid N-acyltransferase YncA